MFDQVDGGARQGQQPVVAAVKVPFVVEETLDELVDFDMKILQGVPAEKRRAALRCMGARVFRYAKGAPLSRYIDAHTGTLYLIQGLARVYQFNAKGERSILCDCEPDMPLARADAPNLFGSDDVQVIALKDCTVLAFGFSQEVEGCACCVKYVNLVRKNMLRQLGVVNSRLMQRVDILSRRSIRAKIAAFLQARSDELDCQSFEVEMNRQDLADFLCVERSALSREIGRMRAEGLIDCEKGRFRITGDLSIYL